MPSSLTGLVLFAAFVLPGYVWMRVEETRRPRPNRSGLTEAADLVFIGLIATSLAAIIVVWFGEMSAVRSSAKERDTSGPTCS